MLNKERASVLQAEKELTEKSLKDKVKVLEQSLEEVD